MKLLAYLFLLFLSFPGWRSPVSAFAAYVPTSKDSSASISSYAALGDSYATGAGAGHQAPWYRDPLCARFSEAYPVLLAKDPSFLGIKFSNLACDAATTDQVRRAQVPHIGDADVVTLTVGGNEVQFFKLVNDCIYRWWAGSECTSQVQATKYAIGSQSFRENVDQLLRSALENRRHRTRLLVTGYARFFNDSTPECDAVSFSENHPEMKLTSGLRAELNGLMNLFNAQIRDACREHGAEYVDIDSAFTGHRFCEAGQARGVDQGTGTWFFHLPPRRESRFLQESVGSRMQAAVEESEEIHTQHLIKFARVFHPTIDGHEAIKDVLVRQIFGK